MSKLFEALRNIHTDSLPNIDPMPLPRKVPDYTDDALLNAVDADQLPIFTNYDIDEMVEYLSESYASSPGKTFGILPVSSSDRIAAIVLEAFMYLSVNCDKPSSLCDLSAHRPMMQSLRAVRAFDAGQSIPLDKSICTLTVLERMFDYVVVSRDPRKGNAMRSQLAVDLIKHTVASEFSLFLFPPVASFNPFCVQMARRVDKLILLGTEKNANTVTKTGEFIKKLGVDEHAEYLLK